MKFSFKFSNILGAVYKKGNLVFTKDGNTLISPVGNRIALFDLKNNKSYCLPVESHYDFTALAISPDSTILIAVNEQGDANLISLISRSLICRHHFFHPIACVKFSPDGKRVAFAKGSAVHVFHSPGKFLGEFDAFVLEKVFTGAFDDVTCVDWSSDSEHLVCGSKDATARVYSMGRSKRFQICALSGHQDVLVGAYFEESSMDVVTVSANGRLDLWKATLKLSDLQKVPKGPSAAKKSREVEDDDDDDEKAEDDIDLMRGELREEEIETEAGKEEIEGDKEDDASDDEESQDDDEVPEKAGESSGVSSGSLENADKASGPSDKQKPSKKPRSKKRRKKPQAPLRYSLDQKHNIKNTLARLETVSYHKSSRILVAGRDDGAFLLYEMPHANLIHSLSITDTSISTMTFNDSGEWIAIGCATHGQLLVWEWQSESYILKQQGHSSAVASLEYSGDGQFLATGGEDGKVKLWNTLTGFCLVTFKEHTSCVTAVRFARNRKFVLSASVDGTVRAFDLLRYRNFRTLTTPRPVQFASLAIDSSSEFVAAGGQDVFEIYLWSLKVGRLLEVLAGHEGPVVSLAFNPGLSSTELASASWDKTLRVWNAIDSSLSNEVIRLGSDCIAVTYRPDGKEVAVATLDCQISMFDPATALQLGAIEGRNDLTSGRADTDLIKAKKTQQGKAFTSLCYSADGAYLIAGGQSKFVCIYSRAETIIVKRYEVTQNRSLDAVDDFINRRKMTDFGNLDLVEMRDESSFKQKIRLPGAKKTDMAARSFKPEIRVYSIQFSPTNRSWAAATTEGLLIYSLDAGQLFDPYLLEESITPATIREAKKAKRHSEAIMMALRLNEKPLIKEVVENVPPSEIEICASTLPDVYVEKLLEFIAAAVESSRFIEFYLIWIRHLLIRLRNPAVPVLLSLQKSVQRKYQDLSKLAYFNKYSMMLVRKMGALKAEDDEDEEMHM
ncbi:periodic tryptophan protein 2 [Nesidiocoris tenuis]|uniref:Periodic tryptophan protein 2 n=1 Tax=Nesidiocoris tenuis TaxID=355587 RepID=A0ABN7BAR5_9HEMI|nr:periodic tryptophan protein 2 [Nesidiocoris tenuis]